MHFLIEKKISYPWFLLITQIFLFSFIYFIIFGNFDQSTKQICSISNSIEIQIPKIIFTKERRNLPLQEKKHDKWIIVTSTNYSTDSIKKLASLKGWKLIVVDDSKSLKDWNFTGVTYLSVEKQKELGYKINELIPYINYARKNIGYLYAIHHGAEIIYETDENYTPNTEEIHFLPERTNIKIYEGNKAALNVYKYYGQPDMWPRGFPLQKIRSTIPEIVLDDEKFLYVPIQQGLVNLDPDTDAIFRLSRELNITFSKLSPIALTQGSMCPYNSQNTIFHKSAFWSTLLPITTTFRVCDIWRSYWTQRLLWDIGGHLAFVHATADQIRNPHNYLVDFKEEIDLYSDAEGFIEFLRFWRSNSTTLEERMLELMHDMVKERFFEIEDLYLMKAWIEDLYSIGYEFPPLVAMKKFAYLIQTESNLPSQLTNLQYFNSDVFLLSWQFDLRSQLDKTQVRFSFFNPNTTWSSGRNLLLQKVIEEEQLQGQKYDYLIFLDDDLEVHYENNPNFDPFRAFERWLIEWEPAMGFPSTESLTRIKDWYKEHTVAMYHFDGVLNAFHRDVIDVLLPYSEMFDKTCWWLSQTIVVHRAALIYKDHVLNFAPFYVENTLQREFPRSDCWHFMQELETLLRNGKDSKIPSKVTPCLMFMDDWSWFSWEKWGAPRKKGHRDYKKITINYDVEDCKRFMANLHQRAVKEREFQEKKSRETKD